MGQSFTITMRPSFSRMVASISPTFSLSRTLTSVLPSRIACRASRVQSGHSESVCRGQPSWGLVFSYDLSRGLSDHRGMNDGFWWILLATENTCQAPLAARERPFSTYFMGACMPATPCAGAAVPRRRVRGSTFVPKRAQDKRETAILAGFPADWLFEGPDGRSGGWLAVAQPSRPGSRL